VGSRSTGAPAASAAATISPTLRSRTRFSSASFSTRNQARARGCRAIQLAVSTSDHVALW
jgi:hypothetical protein